MAVITLTFKPSVEQIISGIPKILTIESNTAATIYYTLDGTLPTLLSSIYTAPIIMPTDSGRIVVSAIAYYLDGYNVLVPSAVLTNVYFTDQSGLDRTRYVFFEGLVYSYPGGTNIPFYYDYLGEEVFAIDVPIADLFPIYSDQDVLGNSVALDNEVGSVPPNETASLVDNEVADFATVNGSDTFNPEALFILIDGRPGAAAPVVDLLNGPYMSLRNPRTNFGGLDYYSLRGTNTISGSALKYYINREKGIICFYYFDSNSSRWVKSIQPIGVDGLEGLQKSRQTFPIVFKWMPWGRQMAPV